MRSSLAGSFLFTLVVVNPAAAAGVKDVPSWSAECKTPAQSFVLDFKSKSGSLENDDMRVSLRWGKRESTAAPLAPAWFRRAGFVSDLRSACVGVAAYPAGTDKILVLVRKNFRPEPDHVAGMLIDVKSRAVISVSDDIGQLVEDHPIILSASNGVSILLYNSWRQNRDGGEFGVPQWKRVFVENGKLVARWPEDRP